LDHSNIDIDVHPTAWNDDFVAHFLLHDGPKIGLRSANKGSMRSMFLASEPGLLERNSCFPSEAALQDLVS
jgi:hypothetical protein